MDATQRAAQRQPGTEPAATYGGVLSAASRCRELICHTPVLTHPELDRLAAAQLVLKAEHLQHTGAFKVRGALAAVTAPGRSGQGTLLTASAGNFGQGVALAGAHLGRPVNVLVPQGTPRTKIERMQRLGARVDERGENFDVTEALARRQALREGLTFLSPFDDLRVIEGQGTVGLELLAACPNLDALVVPCGGGGLLTGIALAMSQRPGVRLVAVEPAVLPSLSAALQRGDPVRLQPAVTLADGVAVRQVGRLPFAIIRHRLQAVVHVSEASIRAAVRLLALECKQTVEGAGAIALAAVLQRPPALQGCRRIGVILSGGNIDGDVLARSLT